MPNFSFSLKVVSGPAVPDSHVVSNCTPLICGRQKSNDCVLANDVAISRKHFVIDVSDGKYWIKDLNSRNGTYLNDDLILHSELKQGDEIRVGKSRLVVNLENANDPFDSVGVAHQSKILVRDSQTTECISPRQLHIGKIAKKQIVDDAFTQSFLDLSGSAILVNGGVVESIVEKQILETVVVNNSACLVFPQDLESIRQVMQLSFGSSSIVFFNHTSPRVDFIKFLTSRMDKFGSPQEFLSEYFELPTEIANGFLQGIDLIVCDNGEPESAAVIFELYHARWLGDITTG